jgi:transposase
MIEDFRVVSCYETGRDGFWIRRYLVSQGIENMVVDSASFEVNRRMRRAKTDRRETAPASNMQGSYFSIMNSRID